MNRQDIQSLAIALLGAGLMVAILIGAFALIPNSTQSQAQAKAQTSSTAPYQNCFGAEIKGIPTTPPEGTQCIIFSEDLMADLLLPTHGLDAIKNQAILFPQKRFSIACATPTQLQQAKTEGKICQYPK